MRSRRQRDLHLLYLWPLLIISASNGNFPNPCSSVRLPGVKCDALSFHITVIRLENLNLSGTIDADSLCKLPYLRILSLADNLITGHIPESLSNCHSLIYLNLSSNMLHGTVPAALSSMEHLRSLDFSNNNLTGPFPQFKKEIQSIIIEIKTGSSSTDPGESERSPRTWIVTLVVLFFLLALFSLFVFSAYKRIGKPIGENAKKELVQENPMETISLGKEDGSVKGTEKLDLIFFEERFERFSIDDLLRSGADVQSHNVYSSLYKVKMKKGGDFVVKRLKNLQVSGDDFRRKVTWIGNLKHPNLLPLVAYHSSENEKFLIYAYQAKGSLSSLFSSYELLKKDFPWCQRLSIMRGIVRGLAYTASEPCEETAPHGNLKPSNILLSETGEPLISEYGIWNFIDPKKALLYSSNAYRAPEQRPSIMQLLEKIEHVVNSQEDYSFSSPSSAESSQHNSDPIHTAVHEKHENPTNS